VTTIGVCEDDAQLRSVLARAFRAEQFEVVSVATGAEALRAFTSRRPDVIVLDLGLPDVDGRDVCLALKANGVTAPVLMLTAREGLHHKVAGFEAGADDYLGKPFALAELMARVRVLERRAVAQRPPAQGVALDPTTHAVVHGDVSVALTPTEFKVLARLMAAPGEVVRRRALVAAGWPDGATVSDNTLDSYVRRLRAKLAALPEGGPAISTVHGVGYSWR
jgi:two-component system OmpR family response regulator